MSETNVTADTAGTNAETQTTPDTGTTTDAVQTVQTETGTTTPDSWDVGVDEVAKLKEDKKKLYGTVGKLHKELDELRKVVDEKTSNNQVDWELIDAKIKESNLSRDLEIEKLKARTDFLQTHSDGKDFIDDVEKMVDEIPQLTHEQAYTLIKETKRSEPSRISMSGSPGNTLQTNEITKEQLSSLPQGEYSVMRAKIRKWEVKLIW